MDRSLLQVLEGGLGYFRVITDVRVGSLTDDDARTGFIRRVNDAIEAHLLYENPAAAFLANDHVAFPAGIVAATEHTGALLLDIFSKSATMSIGGSRASVERFKAQTIVVHPSMIGAKSTQVVSASAHFLGNAVLAWADLEPFDRYMTTDDAGRVKEATIHLRPTPDLRVSLSPSVDLRISGHWSLRDSEDLRHVVETALEAEISSRKPMSFHDLVLPLLRLQELLSLGFHGFVRAEGGRAGIAGLEDRGHIWNAALMPDPVRPNVRVAAMNARPTFHLADLGGIRSLSRWIRLCERHPRAVSPIVNLFRRGRSSDETRLLELASAIEYWVAVHRRRGKWTRRGANQAEAVGHHVGTPFAAWVGDVRTWADHFWSHYNGLKHDPSFAPDPFTVNALQESAYLVLVAELLNRVAGSKQPARRVFGDYRHGQLREWVHQVLGV